MPAEVYVRRHVLRTRARGADRSVNGARDDSIRRAAAELRVPDAARRRSLVRSSRQSRHHRLLGNVVSRLHRRAARLRARAADLRRPRRRRHYFGRAPDVAANYLRHWNIALPLVEDFRDRVFASTPSRRFRSRSCSTPTGNVTYVSVGGLSWNELSQAIERALPVPSPSTPGDRSATVGA